MLHSFNFCSCSKAVNYLTRTWKKAILVYFLWLMRNQWSSAWYARIMIKCFLRKLPRNGNMMFRFIYVLRNSGVFYIKLNILTGICFSDFLNGVFCSGRWSLSDPSNWLDNFFIDWVRIELLLEHLLQFHLLSRFLKNKSNSI